MIICGYFNLVIRQMRGEIDCKAPGLQLLRHEAMEKIRPWPKHDFLHVKRDWNASADRLASEALQKAKGGIVMDDQDLQDLVTLNRLDKLLLPCKTNQRMRVSANTRAAARRRHSPQIVQEEIVQRIQLERIKQTQDEESWISNLNIYLNGDVSTITSADAKSCVLIALNYEVDQDELLLFCPRSYTKSDNRTELVRLVIKVGILVLLHPKPGYQIRFSGQAGKCRKKGSDKISKSQCPSIIP